MIRRTGAFRMPDAKLPLFVRRMAGPLFLLVLVGIGVFLARAFGLISRAGAGAPPWVWLAIGIAVAVFVVRLLDRAPLAERIAQFFGIGT
jgi:hypothetical protein